MRTHGNIVKRVSQFKMLLTKRSNSVLALDKLATNRIINLKIYCTVNENVAQIFLLIGCSKQLIKQTNGKTKSTMKYLYKKHSCNVVVLWPIFMNKTTLRQFN